MKQCQHCGKKVSDATVFCPQCGRDNEFTAIEYSEPEEQSEQPLLPEPAFLPRRRAKMYFWPILGMTLFVLIALIIGNQVFGWTRSFSANTNDNEYIYQGENELWTAEYRVYQSIEYTGRDGKLGATNYSDETLTVTYKRDLSDLAICQAFIPIIRKIDRRREYDRGIY